MDYNQTLAYLYERLPMYQRIGAQAYKKDLTNTLRLCGSLGHPERQFRSVHIAGTNGKGSVSSMICSILVEAGFRTGLYTSPHLRSFTERIRINGKEIPEDEVVRFVSENRNLIEAVGPSFFEVTVAMAFDYFARQKVDIAVVEVGLGGRLDSTNVITPILGVITNISYDHQAMLGNTLAEIAGEKAGIIKNRIPVVVGETHPETEPVFRRKAAEMQAPVTFADQQIKASRIRGDWKSQVFSVSDWPGAGLQTELEIGLAGLYQSRNLLTVLEAVSQLRYAGLGIPESALRSGLMNVKHNSGLAGRMDVLRTEPLVLTDIAHNEGGIREVMKQLQEIPHDSLHIVWGMVDDKDHHKILSLLPRLARYYFVRPDVPRGMDPHRLQAMARQQGLEGEVYDSVESGLQAMLSQAGPGSLGFVGGSTFVVAEVVGSW